MKFMVSDLGPSASSQLEDGDFSFEGADSDGISKGWICPSNLPNCCFISEY